MNLWFLLLAEYFYDTFEPLRYLAIESVNLYVGCAGGYHE